MPVLTDTSLLEEEVKFMGSRSPKEPPRADSPSTSEDEDDEKDGSGHDSEETPLVTLKGPGLFDPNAYIDLTGRKCCRAVYKAKINSTSGWFPLVYGRTNCTYHSKATEFAPPKIYVRQPKGSLEHGRMDLPSYSAKEFAERLKKYEADWLLESRIMADSTVVSPPPVARRTPPPKVRTSLREELREDPTPPLPRRAHVDLSANAVLDTPPSMRTNVSIKKDFKIYYGLESTEGEREVLQDQDEAFRWAELQNWNLTGMWTDQVRASTWMSMAPVFLSQVRPRETQRQNERANQQRRDNEA